MDKNFKLLSKRFDHSKLEKLGYDKYKLIVLAAKKSRELHKKSKEQNLNLPIKSILISMDLIMSKKDK
ncbi:MAG: hypothetical protein N2504_07105 [candidate division WOR-3 bacterium]|nr:hypothetical protein [candidate division WOR-3 bacterium]MCX7948335.1 hypothetical protein [candidate division WOR-3 bacterium]MDW8150837.1 hypothetical protein [candidate division WOR-3 bacterium]